MSKPKPARYRMTNWSASSDALGKRGALRISLSAAASSAMPFRANATATERLSKCSATCCC